MEWRETRLRKGFRNCHLHWKGFEDDSKCKGANNQIRQIRLVTKFSEQTAVCHDVPDVAGAAAVERVRREQLLAGMHPVFPVFPAAEFDYPNFDASKSGLCQADVLAKHEQRPQHPGHYSP